MMIKSMLTPRFRPWLPYMLIIAPYFFYFYALITTPTNPILADSFRYLWSGDVSVEFFVGGSLSYRSLAYLLGNHPLAITCTVLLCYLLAELYIFNTFKSSRYLCNCLFAVALVLLFDSSFVLGIHQRISPEGFFVALHLLFIAALFQADDNYRGLLAFVIGVIFILSRNVAPYIALVSVIAYAVLKWNQGLRPALFSLLLPLIIVSLIAANFTRDQDSSVQMNAANNVLARVSKNPAQLERFISDYAMPPGAFIEACRNHQTPNSTVSCFDHMALATSDQSTFSYTLVADPWGFSEWIATSGIDSWQKDILIGQPMTTITEFSDAFQHGFNTPFGGSGSNLFPFDAHAGIRYLSNIIGSDTLWGICILFSAIGLAYLSLTTPLLFAASSTLAAGSVANIFVSYFGDAMEVGRHTYPGYATLNIALGMLIVGLGFAIISKVRNNPDS
jgi:hypothetical protein